MTLSQTAVLTKQVITITAIAIVVSLTSFIGYKIWYAYYLANLPPVEEKPDLKFGQLPFPDFPSSSVSGSNFSYTVDTSTGNLPKIGIDTGFEKLIKVYFVSRNYISLLSGEKSKILAEKFGIKNPPQILSETNYLFTDGQKSLDVDLDNGNFVYKNDAATSSKEILDDDTKLIKDFENTLTVLGVFKEDLLKGKSRVAHLKNGDFELGQISLWPPTIDKKPIVTTKFNSSDLFAQLYKNGEDLNNYLLINYIYYPIDYTTSATYPTKPAEIAFEDLKNNKGVIIVEPTKPQVSITSIYLGYYISKNYSPYLQPVYVFEGPSFVAYVSAITEEHQTQAK